MRRSPKLQTFPKGDTALREHCRRVAGLSNLVSHHLFLPTEQKLLLNTVCMLHHSEEGLPRRAATRLLRDLFHDALPPGGDDVRIPECARGVLSAWSRPGSGDPLERKLADVLRLCEAFDQEFEAQPLERQKSSEILAGLRSGVAEGLWSQQIIDAFEECTQPQPLPPPFLWRIPVFPEAALETLTAMRDQAASLNRVVECARRDPATAGAVMKLANSALFGARGGVSTLRLAIMRLGFETARKVVITLALRPVLALPKMEGLWSHSLEVADLAEQLASQSDGVDPGEAYLAGLLHDVGRIALRAAPLYDAARLHGLEESGCPAVYAEDLILRTDHAELGAQIAVMWGLPELLVCAIRQHHHPESADVRHAHILYLAEYLSCSNEDLPSRLRLELSMKNLGLSEDQLESCIRSDVSAWLASAA